MSTSIQAMQSQFLQKNARSNIQFVAIFCLWKLGSFPTVIEVLNLTIRIVVT